MGKKRIIYFGLLLIVTVMVIVTSFSYSFLIKTNEYHGKLNVVAGTLDYELTSTLLTNNSITLNSNEKAKLNIKIKSLNIIDSKYELFYTTTNNGIEIGYTTNNDLPTGTINANSTKTVNVIIKNTTNTSATITFGVIGGFINNQLANESGTSLVAYTGNYCEVALNTVYNFDYTGSEQEFDPPCSGNYKIETWGASGGDFSPYIGGRGSYVAGNVELNINDNLYVYVGGAGSNTDNGGYNGGGSLLSGQYYYGSSGGGSTDVRYFDNEPAASDLIWNSNLGLNSRIMVAAAGGGANHRGQGYGDGNGGAGGGLEGYPGEAINHTNGYGYGTNIGGTQTTPGEDQWIAGTYSNTQTSHGSFGVPPSSGFTQSGAGNGYYSGGSGNHCGGSGGSSYISGHTGCVAIKEGSTTEPREIKIAGCTTGTSNNECSKHYSGLVFNNTKMIDGTGYNWTNQKESLEQMPNPTGGYYASGTGHTGNGYARVTYLSEATKEEKTTINNIVTFNLNGGVSKKSYILVPKGSSLTNLPTPTKGNEYFKGWYLESTLTTKVDENYIPTSNITLYAKWKQEIVVNRSILDQGSFVNVTPTYLTNQVDGTDGFTLVGTASGNNVYREGCYYCKRSAILRWDYTIDLTDIDKITFYARQDALHGTIDVRVTDGIVDDPDLGPGTTVYASAYLHYSAEQTTYKYFEIDTSNIVGTHVVSFVGGYGDRSGSASSSTTYSNIRFVP